MRSTLMAVIALIALLGGSAAVAVVAVQSDTVLASDDCDSSGKSNDDCDDDDASDDHGGHGGDSDDHGGNDDRDAAAQTALAQPVGEREVRIIDEQFEPGTITIKAGQAVTFVNADDDEHTATGPGFDTGTMQPGDRVTISFDTPGTFDFVCQFHSFMRGTVIVEGSGTPIASPVGTPSASAAGSPEASAIVPATEVQVDIADFSFSQPQLTVRPGTKVTWANTGSAPHTVSGLPADSGTIEPGQSFSFTFDSVGTFDYQCAFHPQMTGAVIVDPNAPAH